jgi:hypothetical protein
LKFTEAPPLGKFGSGNRRVIAVDIIFARPAFCAQWLFHLTSVIRHG